MGLVAAVIIFIILVSSLIKSLKRIREGNTVIEKTKIKLSKINEENKKLEKTLQVVQSEGFIEKQLRDKLGLAKNEEIILVLPEADIVKRLSPQIPEEEEIKPKPNWQKWLELFK